MFRYNSILKAKVG